MILSGNMNELEVFEKNEAGYILRCDNFEEVFLPRALSTKELYLKDSVKVFVYTDAKNEPVATMNSPTGVVGDYCYLPVVDITGIGAFLNMGIEKDLLVPLNQQKTEMESEKSYLVRICLDEETGKLYGSSKLGNFAEFSEISCEVKDQVSVIPYSESELGYSVLIEKKHLGLIYKNEVFTPVTLGKEILAYVKNIRPDGLIDISINPIGMKHIRDTRKLIIEKLKEYDGKLDLHNKSTPQEIESVLGISKQSFKKAVGNLYRERSIVIEEDCLKLVN